jgi:hypothetical protein
VAGQAVQTGRKAAQVPPQPRVVHRAGGQVGTDALEGELAALSAVGLLPALGTAAAAGALSRFVMHRFLAGYGPGAGLGADGHYAHTLTGCCGSTAYCSHPSGSDPR